jgi:hypothetical protein
MIPKLISDLSLKRGIYQQDNLTRVCPLLPAHQLVMQIPLGRLNNFYITIIASH